MKNLTGERLEGAYDERIVSCIFNNFRAIVFKDTKDFRKKHCHFKRGNKRCVHGTELK